MALAPTFYSSADSGAPVLTGETGKLIALLRAILVAGYGAKAGLGWTEPFTATNKAVFRNNAVSGTGYHLRLDDSNTRYTLMTAYLGMSDVDTGDGNPVPTVAQYASGMAWCKSSLTNSTPRDWVAIGNERSVYLFVDVFGNGNLYPYFVGDIDTLLAGDGHHFFVSSSGLASFTGGTGTIIPVSVLFRTPVSSWTSAISTAANAIGGYVARNLGQVAGAVACDFPAGEYGTSGAMGYAGPSYPHAGRLLYAPLAVREAASTIRGWLPGVVGPIHARPLGHLATLPGVPGLPAGADLLAVNYAVLSTGSFLGQALFVVGADW